MNSKSNLMDQARLALSEARTEDAQALLINFIVGEPEDTEAWLLLAEALTDATKKRECLERARVINPRNIAILHALDQLGENGGLSNHGMAMDAPPATVTQEATGRGNGQTHSEQVEPKTPDEPPPIPTLVEAASTATAHTGLQPLLEYGQVIAQAIMMTTEPLDTRNIGIELLKILEEAYSQDSVNARRWARAAGRMALVKYEKALTSMITGLPRDDPQLRELREQRRQALDYLK